MKHCQCVLSLRRLSIYWSNAKAAYGKILRHRRSPPRPVKTCLYFLDPTRIARRTLSWKESGGTKRETFGESMKVGVQLKTLGVLANRKRTRGPSSCAITMACVGAYAAKSTNSGQGNDQ